MKLPEISHLQFAVLCAIIDGRKSGFAIREVLQNIGAKKSLPAFYQLMARMEEAKLIKGGYVDSQVNGERIRERHYKVTGHGFRVQQRVAEFYVWASRGLAEG